jgi:exonuclease SbcC
MKLKTLVLTNFKRHKSLCLTFDPGSNVIKGPNYSGKSTILEAIHVALWGNKASGGLSEDLVHDDGKDFSIILELSTGLTIQRSMRDSSLSRGGSEPFARGHTAVNKALEEELGLSRQAFMKVLSSQQGKPQQILDMEGAELQRFVEDCIDIRHLDAIVKLANRKTADLQAANNALSVLMMEPTAVEEGEQSVVSWEEELAFLDDLAQASQSRVNTLIEQRNRLREALSEAVKTNRAVDVYRRLVSELEELGPKQLAEKDSQGLVAALDALYAEERTIVDVDKQKARVKLTQESLVKAMERYEAAPSVVELISTTPLQAEVEEALAEKVRTEQKINQLRNAIKEAVCHACQRPFNRSELELQADKTELDALSADIWVDVTNRLVKARKQLELAEAHNQLQDKRRRTLESLQNEIVSLRTSLQDLNTQMPSTRTLEEVRGEAIKLKSEIRECDVYNAQVRNVEMRRSVLESQLATLQDPGHPIDVEALSAQTSEVDEWISTVQAQLLDVAKQSHKTKNDLATMRERLRNHSTCVGQVEGNSGMMQKYKNIASTLADNRGKVVGDALTLMLTSASEFVNACTEGYISEVLLTEKGISYREGSKVRVAFSASGAQKSLLGLGLKLGLKSLVQTPFDCMLLDEVSADMEPDISMRCMLALSAFGQSVFVSHRELDVADNVITLER